MKNNSFFTICSCLLQNYYGSSPPEGLEYVSVAKDLNGGAAYCGACVKITPLQGKRPPVMAVVSSVCMDVSFEKRSTGPRSH
jgi:hypothetical protein